MKTVFSIIATIAVLFIGYSVYHSEKQPLKEKRFEQYEVEFRKEIAILKKNQDSIKSELRHMQNDIDTLKVGQKVIYNNVKDNAKQSFIYELLNEF